MRPGTTFRQTAGALRAAFALAMLGAAPHALAQAPPQPLAPAPAPPAEFRLNQVEQAYLDQVLDRWEAQSGQISTFSCDFTRLVYDPVFGPGRDPQTNQPIHKSEEDGTLSYQKPDKGSFEIKQVRAWDAKQGAHTPLPQAIGERWVCNGQSVYEYKTEQKQIVERPIPPEMQGERIVDGPLPFLFGAEAEKIKRRYWLKIDPRAPEGTVWLVAAPKLQSDAANYRRVELMLDAQRMLPSAMRVTMPDESWTVYTFNLAGAQVNSRMTQLWSKLFQRPVKPYGWSLVVEPAATAQAAPAAEATRR